MGAATAMHTDLSIRGRKQRTLIVGIGATGLSCARHLAARGHELMLTDSREQPPALTALRELLPDARVSTGGFDAALLDEADQLIVSPGVSLEDPFVRAARARGLPVVGDIELFLAEARAPVIAITGSNGKSTVTSLLAALLSGAGAEIRAGGNLGVPALALLEENEPDFYVLELSSFQLERTRSLRARAAVVLNVSPDHMDRYASFEDYAMAKGSVYRHCEVAVINRGEPIFADEKPAACISFGLDVPAAGQYGIVVDTQGVQHLARGTDCLLPLGALELVGTHNAANALAALALTEAAGFTPQRVLPALASFRGLPHRCEPVTKVAGVSYVDDSKGTNVGATVAAVRGLREPLVLIAGGLAKGADFAPLAAVLEGRARAAVLIGRDAAQLAAALRGACPIMHADSMQEAVREASRVARAGDVVLLSPACASQDMFEDYRARGAAFAAAVRELEPGQ